jgi:hypothetical protein
MSFFQELKRRKIVRTAITYLGAAFITAQAVQLLSDGLKVPDAVRAHLARLSGESR